MKSKEAGKTDIHGMGKEYPLGERGEGKAKLRLESNLVQELISIRLKGNKDNVWGRAWC